MKPTNSVVLKSRRIILVSIQEIFIEEIKNIIDLINHISCSSQYQYLFQISARNGENLIGYCGIMQYIDLSAVCFYFLLPQYRGNGYAIETVKLLFDFAYNDLMLNQISAYIPVDNSHAWKVAERSGMMYMGDFLNKNKLQKLMIFKLTRSDFEKQSHY